MTESTGAGASLISNLSFATYQQLYDLGKLLDLFECQIPYLQNGVMLLIRDSCELMP